jgi:hypothetical protein
MRVRNGLLNLNGVLLANVKLKDGSVTAVHDPGQVRVSDLIRAIENAMGEDGRRFRAALYFQIPPNRLISISPVGECWHRLARSWLCLRSRSIPAHLEEGNGPDDRTGNGYGVICSYI